MEEEYIEKMCAEVSEPERQAPSHVKRSADHRWLVVHRSSPSGPTSSSLRRACQVRLVALTVSTLCGLSHCLTLS